MIKKMFPCQSFNDIDSQNYAIKRQWMVNDTPVCPCDIGGDVTAAQTPAHLGLGSTTVQDFGRGHRMQPLQCFANNANSNTDHAQIQPKTPALGSLSLFAKQ